MTGSSVESSITNILQWCEWPRIRFDQLPPLPSLPPVSQESLKESPNRWIPGQRKRKTNRTSSAETENIGVDFWWISLIPADIQPWISTGPEGWYPDGLSKWVLWCLRAGPRWNTVKCLTGWVSGWVGFRFRYLENLHLIFKLWFLFLFFSFLTCWRP